MQHEFETTRLAVFIQIDAFQISINNTQIKGKIHVNMTRLVALSGQFLCVYNFLLNNLGGMVISMNVASHPTSSLRYKEIDFDRLFF